MGAVYFYQLSQRPLDAVLPQLLSRARDAGWRVLVRGTDAARLDALDLALWDGAPEAFLPHGLAGGPHDDAQPILLGTGTPAAGFDCVMTVDGADLSPEEAAELQRACVIFGDEGLAQARGLWRALAGAGCAAQFWAEDAGRWTKKAESPAGA